MIHLVANATRPVRRLPGPPRVFEVESLSLRRLRCSNGRFCVELPVVETQEVRCCTRIVADGLLPAQWGASSLFL